MSAKATIGGVRGLARRAAAVSAGERRLRWAGLVAAVAAGVAVVPAAAPPASAATCLLSFYWNTDGTPGWHPTVITSGKPPACGTTPAIVRVSGGTEIASVAYDSSLWFYQNTDGSPVWHAEQVAGPGTAAGNPAIVRIGNGTMIAVSEPMNTVDFRWKADGSRSWTDCGATFGSSDPAMASTGTAASVFLLSSYGNWVFQENPDCTAYGGFTGFTGGQPPPFDLNPAVTRFPGGTSVAADSGGALWFLWHFDRDYPNNNWHASPVGNTAASAGTPAITRFPGGTDIASVAQDGSLWFYWNVDATPGWGSTQVAGPGSAAFSPAIARFTGGTDLAAAHRDGSLWFYWNVDATPSWAASPVTGRGAATAAPAMTRTFNGTEITAVT